MDTFLGLVTKIRFGYMTTDLTHLTMSKENNTHQDKAKNNPRLFCKCGNNLGTPLVGFLDW